MMVCEGVVKVARAAVCDGSIMAGAWRLFKEEERETVSEKAAARPAEPRSSSRNDPTAP
jgi:hypothetical protein